MPRRDEVDVQVAVRNMFEHTQVYAWVIRPVGDLMFVVVREQR